VSSRTLRSYSENWLRIPKHHLKSVGERSFGFIATTVWNVSPDSLRNVHTLCPFKSRLKTKTYMFRQAFSNTTDSLVFCVG